MKQTNQQGFSLAELLIGLAVSIIIITTTAVTLGNTINIIQTGTNNIDLLQESRWALSLMSEDIKSGYSISTPSNSFEGHSLTFVKPNNLTQTITYAIVNNELTRQVGSGKKVPITNATIASINNNDFVVKNINNSAIKLTMTFTTGAVTQTITETIFLMNNSARLGGN
ncbi:MAG: hypothetical protein KBI38_01460 [Negativicutes bacterium]|jgi:Tfp pilus assembly protein PilW|nr:hypothetical protein [Negativicutes bacterium]MBP9537425.1 hypothetical protein [Negativicutes bacterium]